MIEAEDLVHHVGLGLHRQAQHSEGLATAGPEQDLPTEQMGWHQDTHRLAGSYMQPCLLTDRDGGVCGPLTYHDTEGLARSEMGDSLQQQVPTWREWHPAQGPHVDVCPFRRYQVWLLLLLFLLSEAHTSNTSGKGLQPNIKYYFSHYSTFQHACCVHVGGVVPEGSGMNLTRSSWVERSMLAL